MTSIPWQVQSDLARLRQLEFRADAESSRTWREARRASREARRVAHAERRALREIARLKRAGAKAHHATKPTAAARRGNTVTAETI